MAGTKRSTRDWIYNFASLAAGQLAAGHHVRHAEMKADLAHITAMLRGGWRVAAVQDWAFTRVRMYSQQIREESNNEDRMG